MLELDPIALHWLARCELRKRAYVAPSARQIEDYQAQTGRQNFQDVANRNAQLQRQQPIMNRPAPLPEAPQMPALQKTPMPAPATLPKQAMERMPTYNELASYEPGQNTDNTFDAAMKYALFRKRLAKGMGALQQYGMGPVPEVQQAVAKTTNPWVAGVAGAGIALGGVGLAALLASRYNKTNYELNRNSI